MDAAVDEYVQMLTLAQSYEPNVVDPLAGIEINQVNLEATMGGMQQMVRELDEENRRMLDQVQGLLDYARDKANIPEIESLIKGYPTGTQITNDELQELIHTVNHQIEGSAYYIAEQEALKEKARLAKKRSATAPVSAVPSAKRVKPSTVVIAPTATTLPAVVAPGSAPTAPAPATTGSTVSAEGTAAAVLPVASAEPATGVPAQASAADMLALLKGQAAARKEAKEKADADARAKIAKLKADRAVVPTEPTTTEPVVFDKEAADRAIAEMKAALGQRSTIPVDKPLLGAPRRKLTIREGQLGNINIPKRRRDTQEFSFPTHAETVAKKARTAPRTEDEKQEALAQRIVQIQNDAARTKEEKDAARKEKLQKVLSLEPPAPAMNETEADINRIRIEQEQKALEKAQKEEDEAIRLQQEQEERTRAEEEEKRAQAARDTAATAVSSLPPALMTTADYRARSTQLYNEAIAREEAKYGQLTTAPITDVDRAALTETFNLGRLPSAEEQARLERERGAAEPYTQSELAAQEDRRRKREQLSRTESDVRQAKRRRTDLAPELERAGTAVRQRGEDVEMKRRGLAGAKERATGDRRRDEINVWKSSSPLDENSRSVPSALQDAQGLSGIAKERSSLWSKAVVKGAGSSLTSSNVDFDKWLKSKGTAKVLNKAKSAYQNVIGDVQPRTDRGKELKVVAVRRIVEIEDQIRKIDEGKVQKSRLSRSGRSRSPAPRKPRSRSRSPQVEIVGTAAGKQRKREGEGLKVKRRRKSKIVKVNKDPPSTSRYFI